MHASLARMLFSTDIRHQRYYSAQESTNHTQTGKHPDQRRRSPDEGLEALHGRGFVGLCKQTPVCSEGWLPHSNQCDQGDSNDSHACTAYHSQCEVCSLP